MNRILIANAGLLLLLMGFQQWYIATNGSSFFYPWQGLAGVFAVISLFVPLTTFWKSKLEKSAKRALVVCLLIFNPIVFGSLSCMNQTLQPDWTISQLLGPRIIAIGSPSGAGFYGGVFFQLPIMPIYLLHFIEENFKKAPSLSQASNT